MAGPLSPSGGYHSRMLSAGARIALVAPSGAFDAQRLARGVDMIRSWGFEVIEGTHLNSRHRYYAGTVEERTADLRWALTSEDVDAVWFARGGYGTAQTLASIPWSELDGRPVVGFSDATALFSAMTRHGVSGGVHGPVLHSLADLASVQSQAMLREVLAGASIEIPGRPLFGPFQAVRGPVVGGNLCVLASLAGTPWALRAQGCIVMLEDVGEVPYRIDRLLHQLIESGGLDGAVGIGLGTFQGCDAPPSADWTLQDVVGDRLASLGVPVVCGLGFGHGADNASWRVGALGVLGPDGLTQNDVG